MAVSDWPAGLAKLIRNVDRLLTAEARHGQQIEKLATEISALKDRVTRLEAREEVIMAKAGAAASAAATQVAMTNISDISRRIGVLEAQRGQRRLNTPE